MSDQPENQEGTAMSSREFFQAMLQGLVEAAEPEAVIEIVLEHIQEFGHQRFLEGMDFERQIAAIPEEDWISVDIAIL